jgi:hypothetical protein
MFSLMKNDVQECQEPSEIPLHPPFLKGEILSPPFIKGRLGGILRMAKQFQE